MLLTAIFWTRSDFEFTWREPLASFICLDQKLFGLELELTLKFLDITWCLARICPTFYSSYIIYIYLRIYSYDFITFKHHIYLSSYIYPIKWIYLEKEMNESIRRRTSNQMQITIFLSLSFSEFRNQDIKWKNQSNSPVNPIIQSLQKLSKRNLSTVPLVSNGNK